MCTECGCAEDYYRDRALAAEDELDNVYGERNAARSIAQMFANAQGVALVWEGEPEYDVIVERAIEDERAELDD